MSYTNTYEWVRYRPASQQPHHTLALTGDISEPFAAYVDDFGFGVRVTVEPAPSGEDIPYTWRFRCERASVELFDTEWEYFKPEGQNPTLRVRNFFNGTPGSWVDMTHALINFSGGLILDSVLDGEYTDLLSTLILENVFVGTTVVSYEHRVNGTLVEGDIEDPDDEGKLGIGGFDIRALGIDNLRAEKVVTNLSSEEGKVNFKADILALPASTSLYPDGWTTDGDIDIALEVQNLAGTELNWTLIDSLQSSTPTETGKIAELDLEPEDRWDGRNLTDEIIEGLQAFIAQVAADNPDGNTGSFSISRIKWNFLLTYQCCGLLAGCPSLDIPLKSSSSPSGMGFDNAISYTAHDYEKAPASFGYGWSSESSSRIFDQNGTLVFRSGSGGTVRWTEDNGNYIPFSPRTKIQAEVDSGSTEARYKLTFKDQSVFEFDTEGRLRRKVDRNGNALTYSYSGSSKLVEAITDGNGRSHHYTYRADGQPLTLRLNDPTNGRLTQFVYYSDTHPDAPDRLQKVIDPEGNETTFYYYPQGPLLAIVDPEGKLAKIYEYDQFDRVITEETYEETLRFYFYGSNSLTGHQSLEIADIDLVGFEPFRATYREFNKIGNTVHLIELVDSNVSLINETLLEYQDPNDPYLVTKRIDPNLTVTETTYTIDGNIKTITDKDGNVTTFTYAEEIDDPLNPKHQNLIREIQRPTVTVEGTPVDYDPTELQYDSEGNLVKIIDAKNQETVMTYTSDGLIETITDRNGHTTEFVYQGDPFNDDSRNLIQVKIPKGTSPADGFRNLYFEHDEHDNVISVKDDFDHEVLTDYDELDRPIEVIDALGAVMEMVYDKTLLEEVLLPPNTASGTAKRKISYAYDDAHRLAEVQQQIDGSGTQELRLKSVYSAFSQLKSLTRIKNGFERSYLFSYDQLGRQISMADPLATPGVTTQSYEPFCVGFATTTARGVRRRLNFDNRCLPTLLEAGDIDPNDNLEVLDPRRTKEWQHDELGRLVESSGTRPGRYNQALMGFDRYGQGRETRAFLYDELDRLVEMTFEDGSQMHLSYDPEGNLTEMTDPNGQVTQYTYFRDNLLKEVIIKRDGEDDRVFAYSYDAIGRLETISYPEETEIVAKFDDGTDTSGSGWDANGRLLHLRYEKDGVLIRRFEHSYDSSGNRETTLDVTPTKAIGGAFSYDWLDRLIEVRRDEAADVGSLPSPLPLVSTYSYDESDNRIEHARPQEDLVFTYVVDDADNIVSITRQEGTDPPELLESFEHDADGNLTKRVDEVSTEETIYTWDDFDRLERVESDQDGRLLDNRFDVNGIRSRRLDKNGNSSQEYTAGIVTSASRPLTNSSSAPTFSYIMGHQLLGFEIDGQFRYFLPDALSTVREVVDDDGTVVQSYEFDEWGNHLPGSGAGSVHSPKTFWGGLSVNDDTADTGLYLAGHRFFDSSLGRFINRDPIGFAGGLNLYSLAQGNPVTFSDPSGLEPGRDPFAKPDPNMPMGPLAPPPGLNSPGNSGPSGSSHASSAPDDWERPMSPPYWWYYPDRPRRHWYPPFFVPGIPGLPVGACDKAPDFCPRLVDACLKYCAINFLTNLGPGMRGNRSYRVCNRWCVGTIGKSCSRGRLLAGPHYPPIIELDPIPPSSN